ncbi:hypothetical protein [Arthrobacter glacialis]|uniref:hypothetical protein n=1 Tax=Arthrobacter glacialis TaxID=1664 RepID=UPI000CD494FA|nr:hypothetical protein [Arthrobacter glacialis]POH58930.1 hypothetical protein CVS28_09490 [Arthrobacter glacialis]
MVNLTIPYRKPVPAASTMWREVQARWPDCAENKGFVAGSGPTTWNISSHNADADGYAHALDIGVDIEGDGTGIPIQDAIDLSEHLRQLGYKEWKSGRAGRLAYIIHRGQIAGDHTGWQWVKYTGTSPHYDHIHISFSYDYFWGDPIWETTSDVYSTAPWGITTITTGQGSGITPITKEDTLSAADVHAINTFTQEAIQAERATIVREVRVGIAQLGDTVREQAYSVKVFAQATANDNGDRIITDARAQVAGLMEVVKQLSVGTDVDLEAVLEAARQGAEKALAEGVVKVDISIEKPEEIAPVLDGPAEYEVAQ